MIDLDALVRDATRIAREHGWTTATVPEQLVLIHSEVSEALEDYRMSDSDAALAIPAVQSSSGGVAGKPVGFPSELADIVIRVAHLCGELGIDLEAAVIAKMAYNETRPHRHGGKRL